MPSSAAIVISFVTLNANVRIQILAVDLEDQFRELGNIELPIKYQVGRSFRIIPPRLILFSRFATFHLAEQVSSAFSVSPYASSVEWKTNGRHPPNSDRWHLVVI